MFSYVLLQLGFIWCDKKHKTAGSVSQVFLCSTGSFLRKRIIVLMDRKKTERQCFLCCIKTQRELIGYCHSFGRLRVE